MRTGSLILPLLLTLFSGVAAAEAEPAPAGQRIYREGLLPSGTPLRGQVQNGVELSGMDAACARCHRRSGLGGSEGQNAIRPIAGRLLFSRPEIGGSERVRALFRVKDQRPPYTLDSLARALREGVDPSGRKLDALMPRFALDDADIAELAAYLKGLSLEPSPGVTESEIHFATIIAPGVAPSRVQAMRDVLHAFFRDKNGGTRQESRRKSIGTERMYRVYRKWVLHEWVLSGPPETWQEQLAARYRQQPVFAVLSGIGAGSWRPVHEFCEQAGMPCVFPNVDYPEIAQDGYATLYFSRGVALEAEVLARHLAESGRDGRIVQVFRDDAAGRVPAQALRAALQRRGIHAVSDHAVSGEGPVPERFWSRLLRETRPGVLVLWLNDEDITQLHGQGKAPPGMENVYLSGSLIARPCRVLLFGSWLDRMRLVYPFELSERRAQRLSRMNHWLEARKIPLIDERIQSSTYFALTVAGDALSSMGDNFSRDYFIERIEQMTEQSLSSAVYPRLSLGPGQRFASRGGYVARFPGEGESMLTPVSEWIVP
jgi:cytochrome c553